MGQAPEVSDYSRGGMMLMALVASTGDLEPHHITIELILSSGTVITPNLHVGIGLEGRNGSRLRKSRFAVEAWHEPPSWAG
jgi:hypothetical protein